MYDSTELIGSYLAWPRKDGCRQRKQTSLTPRYHAGKQVENHHTEPRLPRWNSTSTLVSRAIYGRLESSLSPPSQDQGIPDAHAPDPTTHPSLRGTPDRDATCMSGDHGQSPPRLLVPLTPAPDVLEGVCRAEATAPALPHLNGAVIDHRRGEVVIVQLENLIAHRVCGGCDCCAQSAEPEAST